MQSVYNLHVDMPLFFYIRKHVCFMVHGKSSASVPKEKPEPLRQETRRNAIVSKEEARKGVQLCKVFLVE